MAKESGATHLAVECEIPILIIYLQLCRNWNVSFSGSGIVVVQKGCSQG